MRRVLIVVWLAGCATPAREEKKDLATQRTAALQASVAEVNRAMVQLQAARAEAERYCAPWKTRQISFEEERVVGHQQAEALISSVGPLAVEPGVQGGVKNERAKWLAVVGKNLARASARPDLPWTFGILESDTPATFSAPGGYVFITTGLLGSLSNEAQVAGFLAHEIVHVTSKHQLETWREAMHTSCAVARTAKAVAATEPSLAATLGDAAAADQFAPDGQLVPGERHQGFASFLSTQVAKLASLGGADRAAELATDAAAAHLVAFAGYDLTELESALRAVPAAPRHPPTDERVAALEKLRTGELAPFAGKARPDISRYTVGLKK